MPLLVIFGLPRSGTTWLAKIFDSHPDTMYRHEPDRFPQLDSIPRFPSVEESDKYLEFLNGFAANLPRNAERGVVTKMPIFRKKWQNRLDYRLLQASVLLTKLGERAHVKLPVFGARPRGRTAPSLIVWKSIESMGRFGIVMRTLDQARGIHLIRHPCGHINSVLRGETQGRFDGNASNSELYRLFGDLVQTPQAQRRGLTLDYLRSLTPVQRLAWRWVLVNEKSIDDTTNNERVQIVRYEDVCESPLEWARDLFNFAGLEWAAQTEAFVNRSVENARSAYYSVYKQPRYSMSRWRDELSGHDIDQILSILNESVVSRFYREN